MTLVIAPAAVAVLVLAACVLPARRALTADPLTIMRDH
jgi:ABC-type lipoprotein release transport system permease subunit